jgi:hypothetical protein
MSVREFLHGCRVPNYSAHPVTGSKVVLTIGHLDHDPRNNWPAQEVSP